MKMGRAPTESPPDEPVEDHREDPDNSSSLDTTEPLRRNRFVDFKDANLFEYVLLFRKPLVNFSLIIHLQKSMDSVWTGNRNESIQWNLLWTAVEGCKHIHFEKPRFIAFCPYKKVEVTNKKRFPRLLSFWYQFLREYLFQHSKRKFVGFQCFSGLSKNLHGVYERSTYESGTRTDTGHY